MEMKPIRNFFKKVCIISQHREITDGRNPAPKNYDFVSRIYSFGAWIDILWKI